LKRAIISDIHANAPALEAVLRDIERDGADEIICLGDVIGYGPEPRACLLEARAFRVNLMGNHEEAVLFGAVGFNPKARDAIDWTRDQLGLPTEPVQVNRELWNFLGALEKDWRHGNAYAVHGSPRDPTREYVFVQDIQDHEKMDQIFAASLGTVCFIGHTHIPGIFTDDHLFYPPAAIGRVFTVDERKILVNVGSVGQPRDGDPRSSYVIFDGETIRYRRVEYDVREVLRRFARTPLPRYLATRLEEGK